jgi:hypothetical protein
MQAAPVKNGHAVVKTHDDEIYFSNERVLRRSVRQALKVCDGNFFMVDPISLFGLVRFYSSE